VTTTVEGPPAQALAERLARCPDDFLLPPRIAESGSVVTAAVVSDLLVDLGGEALGAGEGGPWSPGAASPEQQNRLSCVLVTCWLLHDDRFLAAGTHAPAARRLLESGLDQLAALARARSLVTDPERRAELSRITLRALGLTPAGESEAVAADRLASLDSVARARVLAETRAAARRAEEIRAAMRARAAAEAAARVMPE
jgi:hypothetical protein